MNGRLGQEEFSCLLSHVRTTTGMRLPETNYDQTERFVLSRIDALDCSFDAYLSRLREDSKEQSAFLDVVTINETYFFREERHFSLLLSNILPELRRRGRFPIRAWSAACATGEEPLSLYFVCREVLGSDDRFVVHGSDLSRTALSAFAEGQYSANSFRQDGSVYHGLVRSVASSVKGKTVIPQEIIANIQRSVVNLIRLDGNSFSTRFDIILLRNLLIYFDLEERNRIVDSVVEQLDEGGVLMVSATEIPLVASHSLKLLDCNGVFCFRKKTFEEKEQGVQIDPLLMTDVAKEEQVVLQAPPTKAAPNFVHAVSYVNAKLNNRQFTATEDPSYCLALKIIEILYAINAQEFEKATDLLGEIERTVGPNEVTVYLHGYMKMTRFDHAGAIKDFGTALAYKPRFWPARYRRAILRAKNNEILLARKDFQTCVDDIDAYIGEKSYAYEFLLDGFNGRYFRRICETWLSRTSSTRNVP